MFVVGIGAEQSGERNECLRTNGVALEQAHMTRLVHKVQKGVGGQKSVVIWLKKQACQS